MELPNRYQLEERQRRAKIQYAMSVVRSTMSARRLRPDTYRFLLNAFGGASLVTLGLLGPVLYPVPLYWILLVGLLTVFVWLHFCIPTFRQTEREVLEYYNIKDPEIPLPREFYQPQPPPQSQLD